MIRCAFNRDFKKIQLFIHERKKKHAMPQLASDSNKNEILNRISKFSNQIIYTIANN